MPVLSGISPNSANADSAALTVTATGSDFVSGSTIEWNGATLVTTYGSSTSLTAQIPASDLSSAGTASVAVQNPVPGGGTSSALSFTINAPPNPTPTITSLSPSSANAGGPAISMMVTGTNFISSSEIQWNGADLVTTYGSSTSLTAQIPASDIASTGTASVTVQNPAPGGGASEPLTFTISQAATNLTVLDIEGNTLAWNPSDKKLYVAVPSSAATNASTITVVDPTAGAITGAQALTSPASGLAISSDSQFLYAVTGAGSEIQRLSLPSLIPGIQWSLGTELVGDIEVQPGSPHTLAVSMGQYGSGTVAVFDDAVERPATASSPGSGLGNWLLWKADGSELYDAYTFANASGYYTSVSDDALFTMPVTASGVGAITTYDSTFRTQGSRLHSDPATGYIYSDWGEIINGSSGIPVGNYPGPSHPVTYLPGQLAAVDPTLKRFYTLLQVTEPDNTTAFQIQSFDQNHFQLLSTIVIPNAVGTPTNFIRWGQSGLAFVTDAPPGGVDGKLYILDGGFVNSSGAMDTAAGTQIDPVPTLTAISPLTATVGSSAVTLTITGRDFIGQSTVYWNGQVLQTTLESSTELTAQVPASDLAAAGQGAITASNSGSDSPVSNSMPFSVNSADPSGNKISVYNTGGYDLVWDSTRGKIYVSVPGIQGDSGDAIAIVDPVAGTVSSSGFLGSDPNKISLSSDSQYLYVGLNGANEIQQLTVPGFSVQSSWNLGGVGTFEGPYFALDLQAAPGAPQTTAVTLANFDVSPSSVEVTIYDGSTPRPSPLPSSGYDYSSLQWAGTGSTLYTVDQGIPQNFLVLGVDSSGVQLNQHYDGVLSSYSPEIRYDGGTGLVYSDAGQAIQPTNGSLVGSYGASGMVVPDSTLDRVFILGQTAAQTGTSNYTIESFDQTKFTAVSSITIDNVVGVPTGLIRWGSNGLAFTTLSGYVSTFDEIGPGQLYVVSGNFVNPSGRSSQPLTTTRLLPVQRTWNLGTAFTRSHGSAVVRPNPLVH